MVAASSLQQAINPSCSTTGVILVVWLEGMGAGNDLYQVVQIIWFNFPIIFVPSKIDGQTPY